MCHEKVVESSDVIFVVSYFFWSSGLPFPNILLKFILETNLIFCSSTILGGGQSLFFAIILSFIPVTGQVTPCRLLMMTSELSNNRFPSDTTIRLRSLLLTVQIFCYSWNLWSVKRQELSYPNLNTFKPVNYFPKI